MADLLENCELCYPYVLSELPDVIVIEGGLDPLKDYYFKFTDKFPNSFITEQLTPNVDGDVVIQVNTVGVDLTNFITPTPPAAWLNKNAGRFYIEASETLNTWTPVTFTFGTETYTCIVVQFAYDNSETNTIK
jgi:hypothetical protein